MAITSFPENPNDSGFVNEIIWTFSGSLSTLQNNLIPKYLRSLEGIVEELEVLLQEAPVGSSAIFTFKINGVSIGTVTVAAGATQGSNSITPYAFGSADVFTVEITQVGSTTPGTTATMIARLA